jgi:hypothetical protein
LELKYCRKEGRGGRVEKYGESRFFKGKKRKQKRGYIPQRIRKWRMWDEVLIYDNLIQNM